MYNFKLIMLDFFTGVFLIILPEKDFTEEFFEIISEDWKKKPENIIFIKLSYTGLTYIVNLKLISYWKKDLLFLLLYIIDYLRKYEK